MANSIDIKPLLKSVQKIVKHHKELEIAKGEKFNVFSILKMESKENETHSAFLAELLNPEGSHLQGNVFLKLLLNQLKIEFIDLDSAKVTTEFYIGIRNDKNKTGGRIDIFISDNNNSISIENKIYASDQYAQIERYCNYNKSNNRVYYLTLKGSEPSPESKGKLVEDEDFYILSYRNNIVEWLSACLKETAELPILRESIKQYLLLIKKLTHQMEKTMEKKLLSEIYNNLNEARYIAQNYDEVINLKGKEIREQVIIRLKESLQDKYAIIKGKPIESKFAQIWIKIKEYEHEKLFFGIETFNGKGHNGGELFIGVFNNSGKHSDYFKLLDGNKSSRYWANTQIIPEYKNCKAKLSDAETIKRLYNDSDFQQGFIEHIVNHISKYLKGQTESLCDYFKSTKTNS